MSGSGLPGIRNYRRGDEERWLALVQACPDFTYDMFNRSPSRDALRVLIEHPYLDTARDLFFAEESDEFVGQAELWHAPGAARTVGRVLVHPRWRRRGLGGALLSRIEQRGLAYGGHYLDIMVAARQNGPRQWLAAKTFRVVHYSWQMTLRDARTVATPDWPAGYGRRSFVPGQDERTSVQLENEAFQDEWEFMPVELGEIEALLRSPSFRPAGAIYATHQGQVVGECWNWIDDEAAARTGQRFGDVWCLCVLPQHRSLGLGRALLEAGVRWLRERGMDSVHLCVDGANARAKRLYESVGFVEDREDVWYRKELRDPNEPLHVDGGSAASTADTHPEEAA